MSAEEILEKVVFADGQALSVGFSSPQSLIELKTILYEVASSIENKNTTKDLKKVNEETKNHRESLSKIDFVSGTLSTLLANQKKRDKVSDSVKKTLDRLEKTSKIHIDKVQEILFFQKLLEKKVSALSNKFGSFLDNMKDFDTILAQMTKAGTFFAEGGRNLNAITASANKIGVTLKDFITLYTRNSQQMIRANNLGLNGSRFVTNQLGLHKNILGMGIDDMASVVDMFNTTLQFESKKSIADRDLINETFTLGKFMKDLSIATGKSVEALVKENEMKEDNLRLMALEAKDKKAFTMMKAAGFSDKEMLYLTSGIMSSEVAAIMSSANGSKMMSSARDLWLKRQQGLVGDEAFRAGMFNSSKYGAAQADLALEQAGMNSVFGYDAVGGRNSFMYNRAGLGHKKAMMNMDWSRTTDPERYAQDERLDALKKNTMALNEISNNMKNAMTLNSKIADAFTTMQGWILSLGGWASDFFKSGVTAFGIIINSLTTIFSINTFLIGIYAQVLKIWGLIATEKMGKMIGGKDSFLANMFVGRTYFGKAGKGVKLFSKNALKASTTLGKLGRVAGLATAAIGGLAVLLESIGAIVTLSSKDASSKEKYAAGGKLAGQIGGGVLGFFLGGPLGAMLGASVGGWLGEAIGGLFGSDDKPNTSQSESTIESSSSSTYNGPAGMTGYGSVKSNGPVSSSSSSYSSAGSSRQTVTRDANSDYLENLVSEMSKLNHNFASYSANADRFFDRAKFSPAVTRT